MDIFASKKDLESFSHQDLNILLKLYGLPIQYCREPVVDIESLRKDRSSLSYLPRDVTNIVGDIAVF